MITREVEAAIRRHDLLRPGQHVLVGVSGGADSIALLAALHELAPAWKLRLTAAHLNHGIRGKAADADARFVKAFARRLGVGYIEGRANTPRLARRQGASLEMAGRDARYAFFTRAARRRRCDAVATAHTADDQAETVLMQLARGAGAQGLAGIPVAGRRDGLPVVRPLRDLSRANILRYLRERGLTWREDATNADRVHLRNRVRHEVLPFLEQALNPRVRRALARAAEILDKENQWLDTLAQDIFFQCLLPALHGRDAHAAGKEKRGRAREAEALDCRILASHPQAARRRVLRLWLAANGVTPETVDFDLVDRLDALLMSRQRGGTLHLPGGRVARKQRAALDAETGPWSLPGRDGRLPSASAPPTRGGPPARPPVRMTPVKFPRLLLCLDRKTESQPLAFRAPLKIPGETLLPNLGLRISASLAPGLVREKPRGIGHYPARASLAIAAWRRRRIVARSWRPGDRMAPLGMAGRKKVQDIFTDGKVPRGERRQMPLFECGGELAWIPGYRIARGWEVASPAAPALQLVIERA